MTEAEPSFHPRGKLKRRPNFLVILVDEVRYPPVYESQATREYRRRRAGGYDTYYKVKWHVSHADITIPGTYDQLLTFNDHGERDPAKEKTYLRANRLDGFGFGEWIGPEPHGGNPLNSGSSATAGQGRDAQVEAAGAAGRLPGT